MKFRNITTVAVVLLDVACSSGTADTADTTQPSETTTQSDTSGPTSEVTSPTPGGSETNQTTTTTGAPSTSTPPNTTPPAETDDETTTTTATSTTTSTNTPDEPDQTEAPDEETSGSEPTTTSETGETTTSQTTTGSETDVVDTGADAKFSFFVTSYYHMALLSGSDDGFGGDLRYGGAATGLDGADAICQEIGRRVGFGAKTWKAYLSTSTVSAIDRIGAGPWYDYLGVKVADSPQDLISGGNRQPGGCCERGTYDEMGLFHDGGTDQNNDGIDDDDHDTMTATNEEGTYAGFSCEDWTSTTATSGTTGGGGAGGGAGGGRPGGMGGGIMMGHSWPAGSGEHWSTSHAGHQCAAGTNFIQNGGGDSSTVGGGGGYGGIYCFALPE